MRPAFLCMAGRAPSYSARTVAWCALPAMPLRVQCFLRAARLWLLVWEGESTRFVLVKGGPPLRGGTSHAPQGVDPGNATTHL